MNNSLPVVLMDNITVNSGSFVYGVASVDLLHVYDLFAAHIVVSSFTGTGTIAVDVEGSLDGINWYVLTNIPGGTTANSDDFYLSSGAYGSKPARYVRAYGVQFTGTPSATVNVTLVGQGG